MLRKVLLIVVSFISTQAFANNFSIKYEDYTKNRIVTESFTKIDDFKNRFSELNYINHDSVNIIHAGEKASNVAFRPNETVIAMSKRGGEGVGE